MVGGVSGVSGAGVRCLVALGGEEEAGPAADLHPGMVGQSVLDVRRIRSDVLTGPAQRLDASPPGHHGWLSTQQLRGRQ